MACFNAHRFKELREEKGLFQSEIAIELQVSQSAVAMWETGKAVPRTQKLPELAEILGCTVDELLK